MVSFARWPFTFQIIFQRGRKRVAYGYNQVKNEDENENEEDKDEDESIETFSRDDVMN